ncbi:MAG: DUF6328 family protein [Pseudonocardia sp.]
MTDVQHAIYLTTVAFSATATALLIAPVTAHRADQRFWQV